MAELGALGGKIVSRVRIAWNICSDPLYDLDS